MNLLVLRATSGGGAMGSSLVPVDDFSRHLSDPGSGFHRAFQSS